MAQIKKIAQVPPPAPTPKHNRHKDSSVYQQQLLQVFSDPICPWCYIGFHNLSQAIDSYPRALAAQSIGWRTFMLNPAMPDDGMDRQDYLTRKFGGADAASQVYGRIAEAGKAAGLNMRLDHIRRTPETRSAHQVTQALQADPELSYIATDYVHTLFQLYFVDGEDISQTDILDNAVVTAGGPAGFASQTLKDGQYKTVVIQEDQNNRARGLTGVPGFLVGNQQFVGGAQPVAVFHRLFDILVEQANIEASNANSPAA